MLQRYFVMSWFRALCVTALIAGIGPAVYGQGGNNNNNNNNNNNFPVAGVEVNADGVLRVRQIDANLVNSQRQAAMKSRRGKVQTSPMRKVSLNRLEQAVAETLAQGKNLTPEMLVLAGLTRVEYVFYYPETKDIVFAGPAEEFQFDAMMGRWYGLASNKACVRLEDVIVALRTFGPDNKKPGMIGCSIDPTQEGLVRYQQFYSQLGGNVGNLDLSEIVRGFRNSLGMQNINVFGVADTTRFAQVLVEADYRMKLVGIGLERPLPTMKPWIDRVRLGGAANALQRWYFVANYDKVLVSPDGLALKLEGQGVKLVGEDERVDQQGNRISSGKVDKASQGFTEEFTKKFEQIANVSPIFAEMRNLFDLIVAAAYIQDQDFYVQASWEMGVFGNEALLPVANYSAPKQVEPAINVVRSGSTFMFPIGGGVQVSAKKILSEQGRVQDSTVQTVREGASAPTHLAEGQWWWD